MHESGSAPGDWRSGSREERGCGVPCGRKCGEADFGLLLWAIQTLRSPSLRVSWGGPGDRLRAVSPRAPGPSPQPPTGRAQALRQQRTPPPSPPSRLHGGGRLRGSQSLEASATGVYGHSHEGNSFNQLQFLRSSFKPWSSLDQLSTARRWPEVRVKSQGHCTS